MRFAALLFDFDGVLVDSEYAGNAHIADYLTGIGHPITPVDAMARFMGHSGAEFRRRIEDFIGGPIPADFAAARAAEDERAMREGVGEIAGAVAFVRAMPTALPKAVVSSSHREWLHRHLAHLGLAEAFGEHVYSGQEDVARPKPAPDLYLHAADRLGVAIGDCAIIEDSPVGATGAVASGGYVIGLCAGRHCAPGHDTVLRGIGVDAVAADFAAVSQLLR